MNSRGIELIVVAVVFGWLWSRLWLWLVKWGVKTDPPRLLIAYGLAWAAAVLLAAFSFATEDGPAWGRALLTYTPALALWLVIDLLAWKGRTARA